MSFTANIFDNKNDKTHDVAAASDPVNAYTFRDVLSQAEFETLAHDWRALEGLSGSVHAFQSHGWCRVWLEEHVFCDQPDYQSRVVAVRRPDGALAAVFPFCQRVGSSMAMVEWLGEPLIQYGDILLHPGANHAAVRTALMTAIEGWPVVGGLRLGKVRADAQVHAILDLKNAAVAAQQEAAIVDLSTYTTFDDYQATQSGRSRKNRRKRRRQLAERGEVTFDVLTPGPQAHAACNQALEWKLAWLDARGLTSRAFADKRALACLHSMSDAPDSGLVVFRLSVDGKPVAIEVSFQDGDNIYAYLGSYDESLDYLGVGKMQMEDTIAHAIANGMQSYDLLAPMCEYKECWSNRRVAVQDYAVPLDLGGAIYVHGYLRTLRPLARKAYDNAPLPLKRAATWLVAQRYRRRATPAMDGALAS
ncbi:MAG: GNAT family N-acetyltransferase [Pseudomonadota bacterium]